MSLLDWNGKSCQTLLSTLAFGSVQSPALVMGLREQPVCIYTANGSLIFFSAINLRQYSDQFS